MRAHHSPLSPLLIGLGLLVGCGGDGDVTEPPGTITVSGLLIHWDGEPVIGAQVLVPGGTPVVSGSDGRFSLTGVEVPYDIAFIVREGDLSWAVTYLGLTRADPTLLHPYLSGQEWTATISGAVPPAPTARTVLRFAGADVHGTVADPSTGLYSMNASWSGGSSTLSGRLYMLRLAVDNLGLPSGYEAYASREIAIQSGQSHEGQNFGATELADPPERALVGRTTGPSGYSLVGRQVLLDFGDGPAVLLNDFESHSLDFSYLVPEPGGSPIAGVNALATGSGAGGGLTTSEVYTGVITGDAGAVEVPLSRASQPLEPLNGATDVSHDTRFRWMSGGGAAGVYRLWVEPSISSYPHFIVYTARADVAIPDFGALEVDLPWSAEYRWEVEHFFPVASMDAAADARFLSLIKLRAGMAGATISETFTFTTRSASGSVARFVETSLTRAVDPERRAGLLRLPGFPLARR